MATKKFSKRRAGFYWKGSTPYVSVTNVLKVIDKGQGLMYWFGKEIYYALAKNPGLSEQEALKAPYDTRDKAGKRGSIIHDVIEAYRKNEVIIDTVPDPYKGYAEAFYSWVDEIKPDFKEHEKEVYSEKYKYAGTCDSIAEINGKRLVVDFKTQKDANIYDEVGLQLTAYRNALIESGEKIDGMLAVALGKDGNYQTKEFESDLDTFLAAKKLWEWKNKSIVKKVGYKS